MQTSHTSGLDLLTTNCYEDTQDIDLRFIQFTMLQVNFNVFATLVAMRRDGYLQSSLDTLDACMDLIVSVAPPFDDHIRSRTVPGATLLKLTTNFFFKCLNSQKSA